MQNAAVLIINYDCKYSIVNSKCILAYSSLSNKQNTYSIEYYVHDNIFPLSYNQCIKQDEISMHLAFLRHLQQKWNSLAHADYGGSSDPRHSFVHFETYCECYSFSPTSNGPWLEWIRHHSGGMLWTFACLRYTTAPWLPPLFPYFQNL